MSDRRRTSAALYEELARLGKALASPLRLRLLELLVQGPRAVEPLAEQCGLTVANASQHLQVLKDARLVESERNGQRVVYRVPGEGVPAFLSAFRALAHSRLAEVDRLLTELGAGSEPPDELDDDDVLDRVRSGAATVVDVRPEEEYAAAHVEGALSIPIDQLPRRLSELPRDRELVVYCRGPFCFLAADAVRALRQSGFRARRLDLGVTELRARRLRIQSGTSTRPEARKPVRLRRPAPNARKGTPGGKK